MNMISLGTVKMILQNNKDSNQQLCEYQSCS